MAVITFKECSSLDLMADIAEHEKLINKFVYQKPYKKEVSTGEIMRPIHGRLHGIRVVILTEILIKLHCAWGNPVVKSFTSEDRRLIQIAALLHDSGREGDGFDCWEQDSATNCHNYLENICGVSSEIAVWAGSLVSKSQVSDMKKQCAVIILADADCLDILRVRENFYPAYLKLYLTALCDRAKFANLSKIIRITKNAIYKQGDYFLERDDAKKKQYEYSDDCFKRVTEDFNSFFSSPQEMNYQKSCPFFVYRASKSLPCVLHFESLAQAKKSPLAKRITTRSGFVWSYVDFDVLIDSAYNNFISIKTTDTSSSSQQCSDYWVIKSIRSDSKCFIYDIAEILINPKNKKIHGTYFRPYNPPQPGNSCMSAFNQERKNYTVKASGVFAVENKKPLYASKEKKGFTPYISATIVTQDYRPKTFAFGSENNKNAEVNVGIAIHSSDVLLGRLFSHGGGNYYRPYDHKTEIKAKQYYLQSLVYPDLCNSVDELLSVKRSYVDNFPNEVLARMRWNTEGENKSAVCIFSDNLESRLLAFEYAKILYSYLNQRGNKHVAKPDSNDSNRSDDDTSSCSIDHEFRLDMDNRPSEYKKIVSTVPIKIYSSKDSKPIFSEYTEKMYNADKIEARKILFNSSELQKKIAEEKYEILLAAKSWDELHLIKYLNPKYDPRAPYFMQEQREIPVLEKMNKEGYRHLYKIFMKRWG